MYLLSSVYVKLYSLNNCGSRDYSPFWCGTKHMALGKIEHNRINRMQMVIHIMLFRLQKLTAYSKSNEWFVKNKEIWYMMADRFGDNFRVFESDRVSFTWVHVQRFS